MSEIIRIPLDYIVPAPDPVRKTWSEEKMQQLADSIAEIGVIQPVKVRPVAVGNYEVIYGHRRVEAARRAGLGQIPVIMEYGTLNEEALHTEALAENVVREDMTPYEIALALKKEIEALDASGWRDAGGRRYFNKEVGEKYGMSGQTVGQYLSLLEYDVKAAFHIGTKHVAQAEAGAKGDKKLAAAALKKAADEELTIRQTRVVAEAASKLGAVPEYQDELMRMSITNADTPDVLATTVRDMVSKNIEVSRKSSSAPAAARIATPYREQEAGKKVHEGVAVAISAAAEVERLLTLTGVPTGGDRHALVADIDAALRGWDKIERMVKVDSQEKTLEHIGRLVDRLGLSGRDTVRRLKNELEVALTD